MVEAPGFSSHVLISSSLIFDNVNCQKLKLQLFLYPHLYILSVKECRVVDGSGL
jgi:hypothetical protein